MGVHWAVAAILLSSSGTAPELRAEGVGEGTGVDVAEACEVARRRAVRHAVESSVGVEVHGRTRVADGKVRTDTVHLESRGALTDIVVDAAKSRQVPGGTRMHCRIQLSGVPRPAETASRTRIAFCLSPDPLAAALEARLHGDGWPDTNGGCRLEIAVQSVSRRGRPSAESGLLPGVLRAAHRSELEVGVRFRDAVTRRGLGSLRRTFVSVRFTPSVAQQEVERDAMRWLAAEAGIAASKRAQREAHGERDLAITLAGLPDYGWAVWFKRELASRRALLDGVELISYHRGTARLRVRALGTPADLAEDLTHARRTRARIRVTDLESAGLGLMFKPPTS